MKIAIVKATGEQVEIISINGGWSTIRPVGGFFVSKVRNGALEMHTAIDAKTAPTTAQAIAEKAAKEPRAKKPIEERLNGVVYAGYLPQYQSYKAALKDGTVRRSIDKGDTVAVELRGADLKVVYKKAAELTGLSVSHLLDRFAHLNPGMQRMNLGNMIRRIVYAQGAK